MKELTKEILAQQLNNVEYRNEMTEEQIKLAKDNNLLVLFCYSDDCLEARGAIDDEFDAYDGNDYLFVKIGEEFYDDEVCDEYIKISVKNRICYAPYGGNFESNKGYIKVNWFDTFDDVNWRITSNIPSSTFRVNREGKPFCDGIVIDIDEV